MVRVIYTVARARGGVRNTRGFTVIDAPGAPGGAVKPEVRRTSGPEIVGEAPGAARGAAARGAWSRVARGEPSGVWSRTSITL